MRLLLFLIIASLATFASVSQAQTMQAVSTPPGPALKLVLTWPSNSPTQRYNLYRKIAGAASYPVTPLNGQPLGRPTACDAIKAVIPPTSPEWQLIANGLALDPAVPFDPCAIATLAATSPQEARLQFLARARWKIAVAAGQGYVDTTVTNGAMYEFELRSVNAFGTETGVLFTNAGVTAGVPKLLPAPGEVTATAGDGRVLLLWGTQNEAAGFVVFRATAPSGPYLRVNEATLLTQITQDLNGNPLPAASNGFLDIQRWNDGTPTTHSVNGTNIDGPANGVTYFYKVASVDLLEQQGPLSATPVSATPVDKTPPMAPTGVAVTAVDSQSRLEVRWSVATLDAEGHVEQAPNVTYRLYRYDSGNAPLASGTQIGGVIVSPPPGQTYVTASDHDPILRPPFGEKTFWYRVEAIDASGNIGARSAAVGGHLTDMTPPAPPKGIAAEGFDDFISVRWNANTEPDLDGYLIYRTLCHYDVAKPCEPKRPGADQEQESPCTGVYVLIGSVSQADAKERGNIGCVPPFTRLSVTIVRICH